MLEHVMEAVISKILLKAENQNELLIGSCQSDVKLTNTQEHILMLLSEERLSNSDLAKQLKVSQAAVTKAVKSLIEKGLLETIKDADDGRVTYFILTDAARPIAREHTHHHDETVARYREVLQPFSPSERQIIEHFLGRLSDQLED